MQEELQMDKPKTLLIPCSGIGKVHGLIGREAVYEALGKLDAEEADTLCLALVVTEDEEAVAAVRSQPCITIDGCPSLCAYKNVELAGGIIARRVRVVDAFRKHKGAKPGTASGLTDDGWEIVSDIAKGLVDEVRGVAAEEERR